jgi:hypothetical protein
MFKDEAKAMKDLKEAFQVIFVFRRSQIYPENVLECFGVRLFQVRYGLFCAGGRNECFRQRGHRRYPDLFAFGYKGRTTRPDKEAQMLSVHSIVKLLANTGRRISPIQSVAILGIQNVLLAFVEVQPFGLRII